MTATGHHPTDGEIRYVCHDVTVPRAAYNNHLIRIGYSSHAVRSPVATDSTNNNYVFMLHAINHKTCSDLFIITYAADVADLLTQRFGAFIHPDTSITQPGRQ